MKKRKLNIARIILCFLIITLLIGAFMLFKKPKEVYKFQEKDMYVASDTLTMGVYDSEFAETSELIRGTKVTILQDKYSYEEKEYYKIRYNELEYNILADALVEDKKDVVLEKNMYVRTPVTIYVDNINSDIATFAKKGEELDVVSYDKLNEDGTVDMYKVTYNNITGYVYAKYLVFTHEESLKNYEEAYAYHKDRKYSMELYGGKAANLDYYPYEKVTLVNNTIPKVTASLYLNAGTIKSIDTYINLAKKTGINTFVIDIKEGGLAYDSDVAKEYSPTSYKTGIYTVEEYQTAIQKVKDAGIYVVGRIVTFKDTQYAKDHPEDCIKTPSGSNTGWVTPYSRKAWEYNVKLSIEAVEWFGFNEIQFDYVRFSESSYSWSKKGYNYVNTYNEEKAQAIQNFLFYATDQIHKHNAYVSADVFGESAYDYVTAYGQYWPAISNIVDAISGMPYVDHFGETASYWEKPETIMTYWSKQASARQKEIPTPATVRTWITAYDVPNWDPYITVDASYIKKQINVLKTYGLDDGYIPWNARSSISKYNIIAKAIGDENK